MVASRFGSASTIELLLNRHAEVDLQDRVDTVCVTFEYVYLFKIL